MPPYLIAEAGVAHFGSLDTAKDMLKAAINAKCDAFKIQTYNIEALIANNNGGWKDRLENAGKKVDN